MGLVRQKGRLTRAVSDTSDIKKALLRQAVRENEDVIKGRYRFRRLSPS